MRRAGTAPTDGKDRSRVAGWMLDDARSEIETRGYYAQRTGSAIADSSALAVMPDTVWNATFGAWTDRVLCIRFGTSRTSNLVIQSRRQRSRHDVLTRGGTSEVEA